MTIEIEVTNTYCKILTKLDKDQLSVIQDVCSFEVEGSEYKAMNFRNKGIKWDGKKRLFNVQTRKFPIGLLSLVTKLLRTAGIEVMMIEGRKSNNPYEKSHYSISNYQKRDYQNKAVLLSIMHGNGIIKAATGAGKTTIAAETIHALGGRAVFVVHTRDLMYQTIDSFKNLFGIPIGQVGDGVINYQDITVATMQTLSILGSIEYGKYKYDEDYNEEDEKVVLNEQLAREFHQYRNSVDIVMFDEVQRICSRTAFEARMLFEYANYAFGYSASPWRDDGSDLMIEAAFGPRICDIKASELIRQGYLVKPIITIKPIEGRYFGDKYEQIYKSQIVENNVRNIQVAVDAIDYYKSGLNTLILVTHIKHGELLEELIRSLGVSTTFISGKSGMKKRRQTIQDMRDGKAPIIIASTIADVGLDVPRLQAIVEAGAGKSSVTALQRLGRIMRPFHGKNQCFFTTYHDKAPYLNTQIDKKIKIWSTEEEFAIIRL